MKYYFLLLFAVLSFVACKTEVEDPIEDPIQKANPEQTKDSLIETIFDASLFEENTELDILKELGTGICNPAEKDETNYENPPCSPKFFKFFKYKEESALKDHFVLLVKSRVHNFPLRRVFVYQRVEGKLVRVNGFVANLIGLRKTNTKYKDLILRFSDEDRNHFNCIYTWRNMHYEYERVEQINDSKVRPMYQDSMNLEIERLILKQRMQF